MTNRPYFIRSFHTIQGERWGDLNGQENRRITSRGCVARLLQPFENQICVHRVPTRHLHHRNPASARRSNASLRPSYLRGRAMNEDPEMSTVNDSHRNDVATSVTG